MKKNIFSLFTKSVLTIVCFFIILVISSCPTPINEEMFLQVKDVITPVITIFSPAEGTECANIVEFVGQVTDSTTTTGIGGEVKILSYEVLGSDVTDSINFAVDGSFTFQFSTVTLATNFTVSITATDWNNNETTVLHPLMKVIGDELPSFTVNPGNQKVDLEWDPVPHTTSYTLYYTTDGSLPSEGVGEKLEGFTPQSLTGLANGNLHVFRLKTVPEPGWDESISDFIYAIPLSPQSLAPWITGQSEQLLIEWTSIPGTTEFEVWRSNNASGPFYSLSGPIARTWFVDTDVMDNQWSWYSIRPTLLGSDQSAANSGKTYPFRFYDPTIVASVYAPPYSLWDVAVSGNFAYVAAYGSGLYVIDITNPDEPVVKGNYDTADQARAVVVEYPYAYVAYSAGGLKIIDVSDEYNPQLKGECATDMAEGVTVSGNYAYVADGTSGLLVVDIFDKENPTLTNNPCPTTNAQDVAVLGNYAYVADFNGGLRVVDISNKDIPTIIGTWVNPPADLDGARGVDVSGSYVYIADAYNGLYVINVSDPNNPTDVATLNTVSPYDVVISDNVAYLADGMSGLRMYNVEDLANPVLTAICDTESARGVAPAGSFVYIADYNDGLVAIDISNPHDPAPTPGGTIATTNANDVAVRGIYAYVADGSDGLRIIDISSPDLPILLGTLDTLSAYGVAVSGSYAYVADSNSGLRVVDVSNPNEPVERGIIDTYQARKVVIRGNLAYVADGDGGLVIIDISETFDPDAPKLLEPTIIAISPDPATGLALSGDFAYTYDAGFGMRVIDISDPDSPVARGTLAFSSPQGIAVSGSYAFIGNWVHGLRVIDISNPNQLTEVGLFQMGINNAHGVTISGSYLYLADGDQGLQVIDISDPESPFIRATVDTDQATSVTVVGSYAYVADNTAGLRVIDLQP